MPPPLYRGVPKNSPRGIDARIRWYVRPRGTSTDYVGHVLGTVPLDADVISWTYDEKVARRFGEVVLKIDEDDVRARIVPHPLPNRYPHEREVLIRGEITGFQIV